MNDVPLLIRKFTTGDRYRIKLNNIANVLTPCLHLPDRHIHSMHEKFLPVVSVRRKLPGLGHQKPAYIQLHNGIK